MAAISTPQAGYRPIPTSWGLRVSVDATKDLGNCIRTTGIFDIAVSEALARLIDPGDAAIDAGANIGYMTLLAAVAAGPDGRVDAFEPHPDLFAVLRANVDSAREEYRIAHTDLHNVALGEYPGTAQLVLEPEFASNDGIARIATDVAEGERAISVPVATLDDILGNRSAAVLKVDVEGYELPVLRGAAAALVSRRIRHIVFENHDGATSPTVAYLKDLGYSVFSLGWTLRGLEIRRVESGRLASEYEAPNCVASSDANDLEARFRPRGWRTLNGRMAARLTIR